MRAARRRNHLAVRQLLRDQDNKRNTKLADLFVNNRTNDFWREVKRTNCPNSLASSTSGNNTTSESIANAFKDQYAAILRSDCCSRISQ